MRALETAFFGFPLRRYSGSQLFRLVGGPQPPIAARFVALLQTLRADMPHEAWNRLRDDIAAYRSGQFARRNKIWAVVKRALQQHGREASEEPLRLRLHHRHWPGWEDFGTLGATKLISAQTLPPHTRLAALRWYIAADVDAYIKYKGQQHRLLQRSCG